MLFTPFNSSKHTLQYSSVCAIQFSPQRGHFLYFIRFSVSVVLQYDCAQIIATFVANFSAQSTRQAKRTSLLRHPFDGTFLFVIGAVATSIILVVARFTCRAKSPRHYKDTLRTRQVLQNELKPLVSRAARSVARAGVQRQLEVAATHFLGVLLARRNYRIARHDKFYIHCHL